MLGLGRVIDGSWSFVRGMYFALVALIIGAAPIDAQAGGSDAPKLGRITGTVYDSLLDAPLPGATVWLRGGTRLAVTDSGGRYALDSMPDGSQFVAFAHPDLDSLGLTTLGAPVTIRAGRTARLPLATPSLATFHRALCPGRAPVGSDSGIVLGAVRDAESGVRLAGAVAVVEWSEVARSNTGKLEFRTPTLEATTDSIGDFALCGVPTGIVVAVQAQALPFHSGLAELVVPRRRIARQSLLLSRDTIGTAADVATGDSLPAADSAATPAPLRRGRAVLAGIVRDSLGRPQAGARVAVEDAEGEAVTNEVGRFLLNGLPSGTQTLDVRLIGYSPARRTVDLRARDTAFVDVTLQRLVVLREVRVDARSGMGRDRAEYEARRRLGFGYALADSSIQRLPTIRSVFYSLPELRVESMGAFDFRLLVQAPTGWCEPLLFIDGFPSDYEMLASYNPEDLVAVEAYPRAVMLPGRYTNPRTNCGSVLVWTDLSRW
ncbi:MAG TPA: carboxypeptidase regulatory-like domain-containing protein [Gemmatimonadaceae bacterium]|nr:carboxypeptidase regulatory-like domain-containing protein [Gemmatimonadaceae bacterium]